MYNADCEVLPALVIHDNSMLDSVKDRYRGKLGLIETASRNLTYDCLGGCLQSILE